MKYYLWIHNNNHPFRLSVIVVFIPVPENTKESTIPTKGCVIRLFVRIIEIPIGGNVWFLHIGVFNEGIQRRSSRVCDVIIDIIQPMATKTLIITIVAVQLCYIYKESSLTNQNLLMPDGWWTTWEYMVTIAYYATRTLSPVRLVLKVTLFLLLHCTGVFLCFWGVLTGLD